MDLRPVILWEGHEGKHGCYQADAAGQGDTHQD
jgi:hypothetical protein